MPPNQPSFWQVDAFTDRPFAGNPAAVVSLAAFPNAEWMQQVAAEMNLAETAFFVPREQANHFDLRWFTPKIEVDLCGHATLATTHVLLHHLPLAQAPDSSQPIVFHTRSGELTCAKDKQLLSMDFPATPLERTEDQQLFEQLAAALGISLKKLVLADCGRSPWDLFVVVDNAETLLSLKPNFRALSELEARGIIVTTQSESPEQDFLSRFFAPQCGIDEDPVTGSAHCCLAPYWAQRLNRKDLVGYQASTRGGVVKLQVNDTRVHLRGQCVTVLSGQLLIPLPS